jgi:REP element-mobilizing transposase RayT
MTFKPYHDPTHLYFITATVLGWYPLFADPEYARLVLDSMDWHRRNQRWHLFAFVLMPTHLHAIIKAGNAYTISRVLQSFGSFTAHGILERMVQRQQLDLLAFFSRRQDHDTSKSHQIWQPIQAKNIESAAFLREKLEYLHNNPIAKKWHLASERAAHVYSSACFYDRVETPVVEVDDVREWVS